MKPIVVAGPTASGKTTLGIQLAKRFGGAVISADSRMVYQQLDIGTGKPTWEHKMFDRSPWITPRATAFGPTYTIEGVEHYGIDLVAPETPFAVTDWLNVARPLIIHLQSKGIRPIIVGGTGLYLRALLYGYQPAPTDIGLRATLEKKTREELFVELAQLDPVTAKREKANHRRLVRALEVSMLTNQPFSALKNAQSLDALVIAPTIERSMLYDRIDQRLQERFQAGLVDEVASLLANNVSPDWLTKLGLEYRYVTEWLQESDRNLRQLETTLAFAIHRYARRQLTYLRHQLPVRWVNDLAEAVALV